MQRLSLVETSGEDAEARLKARLDAEEHRGLLRFLTCGSVDDGKSTLIGRLLYDAAQVYEDQLKTAEHDSKRSAGGTSGEAMFLFLYAFAPGFGTIERHCWSTSHSRTWSGRAPQAARREIRSRTRPAR